jgi:hypothetical protein
MTAVNMVARTQVRRETNMSYGRRNYNEEEGLLLGFRKGINRLLLCEYFPFFFIHKLRHRKLNHTWPVRVG